jgi:hypothetical protein
VIKEGGKRHKKVLAGRVVLVDVKNQKVLQNTCQQALGQLPFLVIVAFL